MIAFSGPGYFSVVLGAQTHQQADWIGRISSVGFIALLLLAYRSFSSLLLSALRAPTNPVLLSDLGPVMPVVVYTGPTRSPSQLATLSSDIAAEPDSAKRKTKHKSTAARSNDDQAAPEKPANKKSIVAKPADAKATDAKPTAKPSDTKTAAEAGTAAAAPKKQTKPKPPVAAPPGQ